MIMMMHDDGGDGSGSRGCNLVLRCLYRSHYDEVGDRRRELRTISDQRHVLRLHRSLVVCTFSRSFLTGSQYVYEFSPCPNYF